MTVLTLETSSLVGELALFKNNQCIFHKQWSRENKKTAKENHNRNYNGNHSEVITTVFLQALKEKEISITDIDCLALSIGPGSFTGIRVGLNFIKTLAYANNIPIITMNSLDIIAQSIMLNNDFDSSKLPFTVIINAHKNLVFSKKYNNSEIDFLEKPILLPISELDNHLGKPHFVYGSGVNLYKDYLIKNSPNSLLNKDLDKASNLSISQAIFKIFEIQQQKNSTIEWNKLSPLYIRPSAAEENYKRGL